MLNNVQLIGTVNKKHPVNGFLEIHLEVKQPGQEVCFIDVEVRDDLAKKCASICVNDLVYIIGGLCYRLWQNKREKSVLAVRAQDIQILKEGYSHEYQ